MAGRDVLRARFAVADRSSVRRTGDLGRLKYALTQYGLRPEFVDIDLDTLNIDLDLVEASIGAVKDGINAGTAGPAGTFSSFFSHHIATMEGKLPALIAGRRANAAYFSHRFSEIPDIRIQRETGESSWFGFAMVLEGRLAGRRGELVRALDDAGIESRPIVAGNFTRNPVMRHLDAVVPDALPAADKVDTDGLFVGNHHYPVEDGIDLVAEVVARVANG